MAKRTRSQKIITDLRRRIKLTEVKRPKIIVNEPKVKITKETEFVPVESQMIKREITEVISSLTSGYQINLIKKDLFKTLIFTTVVIMFELVLYWTLELGGSKLILRVLSGKLF